MSHSSSNKTRKWTIKKKFEGSPKRDDFEIVEEELPPLKDGGQQQHIIYMAACMI
jgi:NADPH-dependent curcumin reductase CurA